MRPSGPGIEGSAVPDANIGDGVRATAAAVCTLRAALAESDLSATRDSATIAPGIDPTLAIGGLSISDAVGIVGNGATIDGAGLGRVLLVNYVDTDMSGVTITGGRVLNVYASIGNGGAGIAVSGSLNLVDSVVEGNINEFQPGMYFSAPGGGIFVDDWAELSLVRVRVVANVLVHEYAGAGIYSSAHSVVTVVDSEISGNTGATRGGGIQSGLGRVTVIGSTISGNPVSGRGSAIATSGSSAGYASEVVIVASTLVGGVYTESAVAATISGTIIDGAGAAACVRGSGAPAISWAGTSLATRRAGRQRWATSGRPHRSSACSPTTADPRSLTCPTPPVPP